MIINKDLKNNDKDISHEYKWGVTSWGDNKTYVIPKKTKDLVFMLALFV